MDLENLVRYLGVTIMIVGLVLSGLGIYLPTPDETIEHVSEFDQEYAEENNQDHFRVPFTDNSDENVTAEDVHTVYTSEDLSNETLQTFRTNIDSSDSFSVSEGNLTDYTQRFVVVFEDGSQHVYEGENDGLYPPRIALLGMISAFLGFMTYASMRKSQNNVPKGVSKSEDSRWEYEVKD